MERGRRKRRERITPQQYAVIGLGAFGASMFENLRQTEHEVLRIDEDGDLIQDLSSEMPNAHLVSADATEHGALRDLGVERFDGAVVATGSLEANILLTQIFKDLGDRSVRGFWSPCFRARLPGQPDSRPSSTPTCTTRRSWYR